jgi:hypothetical protein
MGGLPALAESGADKLPLTPVNSKWTDHYVPTHPTAPIDYDFFPLLRQIEGYICSSQSGVS